ncbi:MAG: hypothetical protein V3574_05090 [Candidatus Moraniibacteriota bacterium]
MKKDSEKTYKSSEVMIMLESISDNVALIAEQHGEIVNRLDGIDNRLDKMQEDISDIKYDLKQKVSYEEFEKMEKRVSKLEKLFLIKSGN